MFYRQIDSPLGRLLLAGDRQGLRYLGLQEGAQPVEIREDWERQERAFEDVVAQLGEYFAGQRYCFSLSLVPEGTPFQREVWRALATIPYGATRSYGEIARQIGRPRAVRALGAANGRNPLPVLLPCHRVIGAKGQLTGYSGGLEIKTQLLALEQR
ncbi:methylated-DNA--[protein]-cysteine S-methyltransferase [Ferrimonas gelatinilytica]|uniref:Methylated-DNA--protein-cysteine methyltransferase n=1 Tax=Ferrimonas gelatinilytica TaxID=1255257 RepID=A0ABP9RVB0_9GAMM